MIHFLGIEGFPVSTLAHSLAFMKSLENFFSYKCVILFSYVIYS